MSGDMAVALADNIGQPEPDHKEADCFVDDVRSHQDKSINQTGILQDYLVYPKSQPDDSFNQPHMSHDTINQPHMSHDIINQPLMSGKVIETHLNDVKSEPGDIITQPQMYGCHLDNVKNEPDDIITQPQILDQETEWHPLDVKSNPDDTTQPQMSGQETESDDTTQPQMSGQRTETHLDDLKSEPDDTITQSKISDQKTEYYPVDMTSEPDKIIQPQMSDHETEYHPVDMKREPDEIIQPPMSDQEHEYHLDDVKSEPDDTTTQPQISDPEPEYHPVDMKNEPDYITQPQMSDPEPEYHLIDMKSEADYIIQPPMSDQETEYHPLNMKNEPDKIVQPDQETEYHPLDMKSEPDKIIQPKISDRETEYLAIDMKSKSDEITQPQRLLEVKGRPDDIVIHLQNSGQETKRNRAPIVVYSGQETKGHLVPIVVNRVCIQNQVYSLYDVPRDGSCYFHCISLSQHENMLHSKSYRRAICCIIIHNWSELGDYVKICHGPTMTLARYFSEMRNGSEYATVCEIQATCNLLATSITVWLKHGNNFTRHVYQPRTAHDDEGIILLLENHHFQLLRIESNRKRAQLGVKRNYFLSADCDHSYCSLIQNTNK